jgi:hypothetical protein
MIHIIPADENHHEETPQCPCKPFMELAQNIDGSIRTPRHPSNDSPFKRTNRHEVTFITISQLNFMTKWQRFRVQFGLYLTIFGVPLLLIIGLIEFFK